MKNILVLAIRVYQACFSPVLGGSCRFWPSCSEYALQAIAIHGVLRGLWLAVRRICKCHPFHAGGYDPVPCAHWHEGKGELKSG